MIDMHTHSLFSDGELIPSELVRRFEVLGYSAVGITDHADPSNLDFIITNIVKFAAELNGSQPVKVIPGIELTFVPPDLIAAYVNKARELGAKLIVVHGESVVEPVPEGTNRAAIEAGADILAHPGLISEEEVKLAAKKEVFLELTSRKGHSLSNGHVARLSVDCGARLVLNSDTHSIGDPMTENFAKKVVEGAGLPSHYLKTLLSNSLQLLERIGYPL
ncbi:MAG: histidinol phosphate phosphatase domain-containing protein [Deltaproteobacteria bacterium]|nr:histidinol phosphate phosphatase domain-containing protein [Deltaproteobacteria bacterium]